MTEPEPEPDHTPLYYGTADLQGSGMAPYLVERWTMRKLMERTTDPQPDRSVVVAANGGGLRAANYTTGVMLGLSALRASEGSTALDTVDGWSSVSGGNFPILQHLTRLHTTPAGSLPPPGPHATADGTLHVPVLDAHLRGLRVPLDLEALASWHPRRMTRMLDHYLDIPPTSASRTLKRTNACPGGCPTRCSPPADSSCPSPPTPPGSVERAPAKSSAAAAEGPPPTCRSASR